MSLEDKAVELVQFPGLASYALECYSKLGKGCVYVWFKDNTEMQQHQQIKFIPVHNIPSTEIELLSAIEECAFEQCFVLFVGCGNDAVIKVVKLVVENP